MEVATFLRIAIGGLLIAHGLVHLLYRFPEVPQFSLERSWLVPESVSATVGNVLIGTTIVLFTLLGLAVWGVPGLTDIWPALAIIGSLLSLLLLVAFWNRSLFFGVLIDLALIAVALIRPGWTDRVGN
jgi:hypothetical protein